MTFRFSTTLLVFVGIALATHAQRIENSSRSTIGYLNADGRIEQFRSTAGYIRQSGSGWTIENSSRSTIGYINARGEDGFMIEQLALHCGLYATQRRYMAGGEQFPQHGGLY